MHALAKTLLLLILPALPAMAADAPAPVAAAAAPEVCSLTVKADADKGDFVVTCGDEQLRVKAPELKALEVKIKAPGNYTAAADAWQPWATKWEGKTLAVGFAPRHDEQGVPILGSLFAQVITDSLKITSADGSKLFKADEDYKLNGPWCQVMAIDGRLGEAGKDEIVVKYDVRLQRLDLLVRDAEGKASLIEGKPVLVCPELPEAPAGTTPLKTLYWPGEPKLLSAAEARVALPLVTTVFTKEPLPPVNPQGVAATLKKLREGQTVRIAFIGDSVTLGAEAGKWWEEGAPHYRTVMLTELRRRFPKATIEELKAFQGGQGAPFGEKILQERVVGQKVDLVLIAFGLNDAMAAVGQEPKNPPEAFQQQMAGMVGKARADGMEVMLVTAMQPNPYQKEGLASRIGGYNEALAAVAKAEGVALADVFSQWMRLADEGIPPYSQLHNWLNHPGTRGHRVYAETILRFFPAEE